MQEDMSEAMHGLEGQWALNSRWMHAGHLTQFELAENWLEMAVFCEYFFNCLLFLFFNFSAYICDYPEVFVV